MTGEQGIQCAAEFIVRFGPFKHRSFFSAIICSNTRDVRGHRSDGEVDRVTDMLERRE